MFCLCTDVYLSRVRGLVGCNLPNSSWPFFKWPKRSSSQENGPAFFSFPSQWQHAYFNFACWVKLWSMSRLFDENDFPLQIWHVGLFAESEEKKRPCRWASESACCQSQVTSVMLYVRIGRVSNEFTFRLRIGQLCIFFCRHGFTISIVICNASRPVPRGRLSISFRSLSALKIYIIHGTKNKEKKTNFKFLKNVYQIFGNLKAEGPMSASHLQLVVLDGFKCFKHSWSYWRNFENYRPFWHWTAFLALRTFWALVTRYVWSATRHTRTNW